MNTENSIVRTGHSLPASSMADLATAGQLLAQAGFLGTRNQGEGFMVLATCQQTGMSLIEFQQKFHLRQGRFSMQAHAMLAELCERGGSYKLIERSPDRAALELTKDGNKFISEITWEDAQNEPFVYAGNETDQLAELEKPLDKRKLKAKYRTPRSRMQMLWARAVSDGVVVIDPGARGGIYTPEESSDFEDTTKSTPTPISEDEAVRRAKIVTAEAADFTIVPEGCGDLSGKKWTELETDMLIAATGSDIPAITEDHKELIRSIVKQREESKS